MVSRLGVTASYDPAKGTWTIVSDKWNPSNVGQNLLSSYHHGGIAGDRGTLKQNEMLSLLEKGEAILDDKKQQALYRLIDFTTVLSDRFSKAIASTDLSRVVTQNSPNALSSEQLANITNSRDIQITFAGESSVMYGLMVYDIGGRGQDEVSFGNTASIVETRTNNRIRPIHFGVNYHEKPLQFKLVFGSDRALDRYELEDVSMWLTGYQDYQWLSIDQPDMTFQPLSGTRSPRIVNHDDNDRVFPLDGIPASSVNIVIDNENGIIQETRNGYNLYDGFNLNFFRLVHGDNNITVSGSGLLTISGRFYHNVAG